MTTVYAVTDLGSLGGGGTVVAGINDAGQVVGGSNTKEGVQHPFLYSHGKMIDLGLPAGQTSATAVAINAKGDVLVTTNTDPKQPLFGHSSAYLYTGGVMRNLGNLPGFGIIYGTALNDSDTIVGLCYASLNAGGSDVGVFIYSKGLIQPLAVPSRPNAINDAGLIVGNGFIDSEGSITPLYAYTPDAVNALGESTGSFQGVNGGDVAIFTPAGTLTVLPLPHDLANSNLTGAYGESINNAGIVVGSAYGLAGVPVGDHALIARNGAIQDLNALIDPTLRITLIDALGINNGGQIVANTSNDHGVLLIPENKKLGSISGTVFSDANADGIYQQGESPLVGSTLYLDLNDNGQLDAGETTTVTDARGHYAFENLWPGRYAVVSVLPSNVWKQTLPADNGLRHVTLSLGQDITGRDFADQQLVAYSLTQLAAIPTGTGQYIDSVTGINDAGQVVGTAEQFPYTIAVQYINGVAVPLAGLGSYAAGINNRGDVVGSATVTVNTPDGPTQAQHAFLFSNGKGIDLDTSSGDIFSQATAINNAGEIVGDAQSSNYSYGFIYTNGTLKRIDPLNQVDGLAITAINDGGVIVGGETIYSAKSESYDFPLIYINGKPIPLSDPIEGAFNSVNNRGQVVGYTDPFFAEGGAVLYMGGKITRIAGLDGANDINDSGIIVGSAHDPAGYIAFGAVDIGGKVINLNDTVSAGDLHIDDAVAINSQGWIAADASDVNQNTHAVLLKPLLASVSGSIFFDKKSAGVFQAGDPPLAGREVYVDVGYHHHYIPGDPIATTDARGNYTLTGVPTGGCVIRQLLSGGWYQTTPHSNIGIYVSAGAGASVTVKAFGDGTAANLTISGTVFNDLNGNGSRNANEPGLADVMVYLDSNNNGRLDAGEQLILTDTEGRYALNGLLPGPYSVRIVTSIGFRQNTPLNAASHSVTLTVGRSVNGQYFSETRVGSN